jgi:hypothetical protein
MKAWFKWRCVGYFDRERGVGISGRNRALIFHLVEEDQVLWLLFWHGTAVFFLLFSKMAM